MSLTARMAGRRIVVAQELADSDAAELRALRIAVTDDAATRPDHVRIELEAGPRHRRFQAVAATDAAARADRAGQEGDAAVAETDEMLRGQPGPELLVYRDAAGDDAFRALAAPVECGDDEAALHEIAEVLQGEGEEERMTPRTPDPSSVSA